MSIDGINRPGGSVPPQALDHSAGSVESFGDTLAEAPGASGKLGISPELAKLDAGELSLDEYLDLKVNQALAHLEQRLPAEQLGFVRESLRAQLSEDPVLVELVRRTTGTSSR